MRLRILHVCDASGPETNDRFFVSTIEDDEQAILTFLRNVEGSNADDDHRITEAEGEKNLYLVDEEWLAIRLIDPGDLHDISKPMNPEVDYEKEVSENCPGCGCEPGEGLTPDCTHELGCGFYRDAAEEAAKEKKGG